MKTCSGISLQGVAVSLWIVISVLAPRPCNAASIEVAAGAWYQYPGGSVAYTYNVRDVLEDQAHDAIEDLLPFDDLFPVRLFEKAPDLYHRYFPQGHAGMALQELFTRTDALDFRDDCNFDPLVRPSGRIRILVSPLLNFSLMATPLEFKGSGMMDNSFIFLDVLFDPATAFDARLRLTHYDLAWFADLPPVASVGSWDVHTEVGLNVRIVDFHAGISQHATGFAASTSSTVPLPMLYLAAQIQDGGASALELEARGTRYGDDYCYDLMGRVKYRIAGPLHLAAGFRHLYVKLDINDIDAEGTFSGPFVETVLGF